MAHDSSALKVPPGLTKKLSTTTTTTNPPSTTTTTVAESKPEDSEPEPDPVKKAPTTTTTIKPANGRNSSTPASAATTERPGASEIESSDKKGPDIEEIYPWHTDETLDPYMPSIEVTTTGSWVDTEAIARLAAGLEKIDLTRNAPPSQGQHQSSSMIGWIPAIMLVLTAIAGAYAKFMQMSGQK